MENSPTASLDLVLVGGGHSHALVARHLAMEPLEGVRVSLVSDVVDAPYSGMLPGLVSGQYTYDEAHIDLSRLCQIAGLRFIKAEVRSIDPKHQLVVCRDHPALRYDVLSINVGSRPALDTIPGALEHGVPIKPVPRFLSAWNQVIEKCGGGSEKKVPIVIIGGGAGGTEVALAMKRRLGAGVAVTLVHREPRLLPGHPDGAAEVVRKVLKEEDIGVVLGDGAIEIGQNAVTLASGTILAADHVFITVQARGCEWLRDSGLPVTSDGFIRVEDTLQVEGYPNIFAAGDAAAMKHHPRPKAGVFAVRQARPLQRNLRAYLKHQPLESFEPQKDFLSLMNTGHGTALFSRGSVSFRSRLAWRVKDRIDRRFMEKFSGLKPMAAERNEVRSEPQFSADPQGVSQVMRCRGCASKVGRDLLSSALKRVIEAFDRREGSDSVLSGLVDLDDAAIQEWPGGSAFVQSVDFFPALVDDPFVFGRIIANHSLNDIYAMGARPFNALAMVQVALGTRAMMEADLYQLLCGVVEELIRAGCVLSGGHTIEGAHLAAGLCVTGVPGKAGLLRKGGLQAGDVLVLTKPIGTGVLFAGLMRGKAKGRWIRSAVKAMTQSNGAAAAIFCENGVTGCTDVTGFGLAGHAMEMAESSQVAVHLRLDNLPILDGALDLVTRGVHSSLYGENARVGDDISGLVGHPSSHWPLIFDPQTAGGLLAGVPGDRASRVISALKEAGYHHARIIGSVEVSESGQLLVG